jgi:hypothetical protein
MKLKSITSQSFINLKNYKPFYYFNTESRLNKLDKDTMIKVNGVTHYIFNGKDSKATPVAVELEDTLIEETLKVNSEDFVIEGELIFD